MSQVKERVPATPIIYKDFSLSFTKHPATGDIVTVTNQEAIKRSVKHLILSNFYDNKFEPHIGSNVRNFLFEQVTPVTSYLLKRYITNTINNFERRVRIIDVDVRMNTNIGSVAIAIQYEFQNLRDEIRFNLELERLR